MGISSMKEQHGPTTRQGKALSQDVLVGHADRGLAHAEGHRGRRKCRCRGAEGQSNALLQHASHCGGTVSRHPAQSLALMGTKLQRRPKFERHLQRFFFTDVMKNTTLRGKMPLQRRKTHHFEIFFTDVIKNTTLRGFFPRFVMKNTILREYLP